VRHMNIDSESQSIATAIGVPVSDMYGLQQRLGMRGVTSSVGGVIAQAEGNPTAPILLTRETNVDPVNLSPEQLARVASFRRGSVSINDSATREAVVAAITGPAQEVLDGSNNPALQGVNAGLYANAVSRRFGAVTVSDDPLVASRVGRQMPIEFLDAVRDIANGAVSGQDALKGSLTQAIAVLRAQPGEENRILADALTAATSGEDAADFAAVEGLLATDSGRAAISRFMTSVTVSNPAFNTFLTSRLSQQFSGPEATAAITSILSNTSIPEAERTRFAQNLLAVSSGSADPEAARAAIEDLRGQVQSLVSEDTNVREALLIISGFIGIGAALGGGATVGEALISGVPLPVPGKPGFVLG